MSKVKICGLTRRQDAEAAVLQGASYLGAVLVESSPRCVAPDEARALAAGLDARLAVVVADENLTDLIEKAHAAGADVIQLHGSEDAEDVRRVARAGEWDVWKAVRVRKPESLVEELPVYAGVADGILLEGFDEERLGGSGASFDWSTVAPLLEGVRGRVTLVVAGGLTPDNVGRAVATLNPDIVDVSSGVESEPGVKDPDRIHAFIQAATP